jgi:hypothetical protein
LGRKGKWEYFRVIYGRYGKADRRAKREMLNEFCLTTGYHRKYAIRILNGPAPGKRADRPVRKRGLSYGHELLSVLTSVWEAAGYPWSVRLKALLPTWMPWIRKRFKLSAAIEKQLLSISPRQMDRRLAAKKDQQRRRIYGRTKPGYLLKQHIPVKTDSWDVKSPGFTEVDLVSHSGNSAEGEFGYSLNVTDIQTTWTETRALLGKGQTAVQQALDEIEGMLPFRLLGLDSDNGSEFINWHLKAWCERKQIQLTRGRPYKKDDNAHIEQKNWTHVRKLLGWERYDTQNAVDAMNDLYRRELRLWLNLYLPSVKLLKKVHVGSKLRRVYDGPKTPFERVVASKQGDTAQLTILKELRRSLDPFQLAKVIDRKLERIYRLANRRLSPKAQEKSSQAQSGRRKGRGKDAEWKSPKAGFSTPLGNLAQTARFPLSHSHNKPSTVTYQMARRGPLELHF